MKTSKVDRGIRNYEYRSYCQARQRKGKRNVNFSVHSRSLVQLCVTEIDAKEHLKQKLALASWKEVGPCVFAARA